MENTKQPKITTPMAIIIAGFLIMVGVLLTNNAGGKVAKAKTLSEQVGVSQTQFKQCMDAGSTDTNLAALKDKTDQSADLAMKALPQDQRGTPYSIVVGKNGAKAEIRGAYPIEEVRKIIEEVKSGKTTVEYQGEIPEVTADDHIIGSIDAPIVIVEYSDLECPYCKRFSGVMKQIVDESDGQVAWVYRHWIVHQGALAKTVAAECVSQIKGEEAFWKYVDLVFGLMKTADDAPDISNL